MTVGVVGHVEWVDFALVDHLPRAGEIVEASSGFAEPGGGGAVAAVQLARMVGDALFLTAVGDDALGREAEKRLRDHWHVDVHAAVRDAPQRRAFTHLDEASERTITVIGERLVPHREDDLPWERLADCGGVYFTGGDAGALEAARAAGVLVATPRGRDALVTAGVEVDVLVGSGSDAGEAMEPDELDPPPRLVVRTEGERGGRWQAADGTSGRWETVAPPGPPVDTYGCGDTFAAALTAALGAGQPLDDALRFAATCGAWCLAGRGPYGHDVPCLDP